ncbi:MAG: hypothetical protein WCP20_17075 [Desulfuromonadales bacterium]
MKRHILIFIIAFLIFRNREASAFWWGDSTNSASGLNVAAGFDVNTITTVTGTVMTPPERKGQDQLTVMSVTTSQGIVTVVLGPWDFWEKQNSTFAKNQDIAITGSLAQGKDGALYIFAQRIENRSNGETVTLRTESGKPLWSRAGSGNQNEVHRNNNGNGPRSGAGNRGSGMRGGRR